MASFETAVRRILATFRRENAQGQDEPLVAVGYLNTDGSIRAVPGDDDAPYAHAIGRASSNGTAAVQVAAGEAQRVLVDLDGKVWVRGSASGATEGFAVADPCVGNPTPVAAGATTPLVTDLNGRAVVIAQGYPASDEVDCGAPVKIGARAVATGFGDTAVAAGDRVDALADLTGHLLVNPRETWTQFGPTLGNASGQIVIKASAGRLRRLIVNNTSAVAAYYVQLHDTNAVGSIATGTRAASAYPLPANGFVEIDMGSAPQAFATGVAVALSTTLATYTAGTDTGEFSGQYE